MDSDAAPECDLSLSTALQSENGKCEGERRRAFWKCQIAVLLLSRFLVQLFVNRSSPSYYTRNIRKESCFSIPAAMSGVRNSGANLFP